MVRILKEKEEKVISLENSIYTTKMKLGEVLNLAFESGATDFIEKIENSVLQNDNP